MDRSEITGRRLLNAIRRRIAGRYHFAAWKMNQKQPGSHALRLKEFKDLHHGERCVILGNGPSLAKMDLAPLRHLVTYGLNRIFLNFPSMGFSTTYHVSMNNYVLQQSAEDIKSLRVSSFINWSGRHYIDASSSTYYLLELFRPGFYRDVPSGVWGGATVTYVAMQLAFFMGFKEVVLIGIDHDFVKKGTPHTLVVSNGQDADHFNPQYFPKGFQWQLPDLRTSGYAYRLAREAFEADGRQVLDATIGGKLDVFPKVDFDSLF